YEGSIMSRGTKSWRSCLDCCSKSTKACISCPGRSRLIFKAESVLSSSEPGHIWFQKQLRFRLCNKPNTVRIGQVSTRVCFRGSELTAPHQSSNLSFSEPSPFKKSNKPRENKRAQREDFRASR